MTRAEPSIDGVASSSPVMTDERVFRQPWEAQAFAITVLLHERGLFTWTEWAQALGAQIATAKAKDSAVPGTPGGHETGAPSWLHSNPAPDTPYYHHWLAALESLVATKGAGSPAELTRYQRAWKHAAHRTPHGQPIALQSQDFEA